MRLTNIEKKKINEVGKKFNLKLMLVYGSYARDSHRKDSDLDIACLGNSHINFDNYCEIYSDLADIFGDIERELDVVILQEKDPLFLYQVAKNSRLLYGDMTDYNEFRAFAFRNYIDSRDLRDLEKKLALRYQKYLNTAYASG